MKVEVGSFTVNSSTMTGCLDDYTINIKSIHFQISPNSVNSAEESTGFSDSVKNRAKSTLVSSAKKESKRTTSYAITHYKDVSGTTTRVIAGKVDVGGFATTGEFTMTFDDYDPSYTIDFIAYGE